MEIGTEQQKQYPNAKFDEAQCHFVDWKVNKAKQKVMTKTDFNKLNMVVLTVMVMVLPPPLNQDGLFWKQTVCMWIQCQQNGILCEWGTSCLIGHL